MNAFANAFGAGPRTSGRSRALQQWGPLVGGGALALLGLSRRSTSGMVLAATGGLFAYMGSGQNTANTRLPIFTSVAVSRSPEEAYRFWRDFENLPRFMRHLESVRGQGDRRSESTAIGPMGAPVQWQTEIVDDRPNERIAWRSLPGSDVEVDGSVEFRQATDGRGTRIDVNMRYRPPAGTAGHVVAKLLGRDPHFMVSHDLRRFKALLETGEIPTIEGQTHGPRDAMTGVLRTINPDQPLHRGAVVSEMQMRRRSA
ncbi:MAG TPA: SRPBCC family protein [Terriglobales bacterium]